MKQVSLGMLAWVVWISPVLAEEMEAEITAPGPTLEFAVGSNLGILNGTSALGIETRGHIRLPGEDPLYVGLILGLTQWSPYRWSGGSRVTDSATHVQALASLSWRGDLWRGVRPRLGLVAGLAWMNMRGQTQIVGGTVPGDTSVVGVGNQLGFVFGVAPGLTLPFEEAGVEVGFEMRAGIYDLDPFLSPGFHIHASL